MGKRGPERKKRVEAEAALVSAYVDQFYPADRVMIRVSLGAIEPKLPVEELEPEELYLSGRYRRWADALVIRADRLILIEGAIRPSLGDISILKGYARLVPLTPELGSLAKLPIELQLVGAVYDPVVERLCHEEGIKYIQFTTDETEAYLDTILPRHRSTPRSGGLA
jgi:hypothetical protein